MPTQQHLNASFCTRHHGLRHNANAPSYDGKQGWPYRYSTRSRARYHYPITRMCCVSQPRICSVPTSTTSNTSMFNVLSLAYPLGASFFKKFFPTWTVPALNKGSVPIQFQSVHQLASVTSDRCSQTNGGGSGYFFLATQFRRLVLETKTVLYGAFD